MELEWKRTQDFERMEETITFSGSLTLREIANLKLNAFDRRLLDECGTSNMAEDFLLALEMLFRRHREQTTGALEEAKKEGNQ